jgi:hypothetical protein
VVTNLDKDIDKETASLSTYKLQRAMNAVLRYFRSTGSVLRYFRSTDSGGEDDATIKEIERDIRNLKLRRTLWRNCKGMTEMPLVFMLLLCRPSYQLAGIGLLQIGTLRPCSIWQRLGSVLLGCFQFSRVRAGHDSAGVYCLLSLSTFLLRGCGLAEGLLGIVPMVAASR